MLITRNLLFTRNALIAENGIIFLLAEQDRLIFHVVPAEYPYKGTQVVTGSTDKVFIDKTDILVVDIFIEFFLDIQYISFLDQGTGFQG